MHDGVFMDIVHVEDDPDLAEALQVSLENFGFVGNMLHADRVAEACRIIDSAERLDIVFSDMNLPDGTGLDVIRHVRAHSLWGNTPIVVLSSDTSPAVLGSAYALGANSYVLKAPRGRSPLEMVKSLYNHWLRDVALPPAHKSGPGAALMRLAKLRERHSRRHANQARLNEPAEIEEFHGVPT